MNREIPLNITLIPTSVPTTYVTRMFVPSDHGANQNPETIAEVMRILKGACRKQRLGKAVGLR